MSVCNHCESISSYHKRWCPARYESATTAPQPPTHRIEWFGRLQVHQPVKKATSAATLAA